MPTSDELRMLQALPLDLKVRRTEQRIREWVDYWGKDHVCVSFSGGKDSTVLLHIVRKMYGDEIPAVFVNTGLEYPEVQRHVRKFKNVVVLRPKMNFRDVITKYGYPVVSKEISQCIYEARRYYSNFVNVEREREREERADVWIPRQIKKLFGIGEFALRSRGARSGTHEPIARSRQVGKDDEGEYPSKNSRFSAVKYQPLLWADFEISHICCKAIKKDPINAYLRETGRHSIIGTMAAESFIRRNAWIRYGCNSFEGKNPSSKPMSFWTEQDVLQYILENHLQIADCYGEILPIGNDGQMMLDVNCKYKCTGCQRTGCIFCGFGAQGDGRFVDLAQTHPKQYAYCINGGAYDPEDGFWKPTKDGLGMGHVFDEMNRLLLTKTGRPYIRYLPEGGEMDRARKLDEEKKKAQS